MACPDCDPLRAQVAALEKERDDTNRIAAEEIRQRDQWNVELLGLLRRCGETFEHALLNVKALTGGDERRMRAMLAEIAVEVPALATSAPDTSRPKSMHSELSADTSPAPAIPQWQVERAKTLLAVTKPAPPEANITDPDPFEAAPEVCQTCGGTGFARGGNIGSTSLLCQTCVGTGKKLEDHDGRAGYSPCPDCSEEKSK